MIEGTSDDTVSSSGVPRKRVDRASTLFLYWQKLTVVFFDVQLRQRLQLHKRPVAMRSTRNYGGSALAANVEPDQTLEIMMSDLDPDIMKIFTKEVSATAAEATQVHPSNVVEACDWPLSSRGLATTQTIDGVGGRP